MKLRCGSDQGRREGSEKAGYKKSTTNETPEGNSSKYETEYETRAYLSAIHEAKKRDRVKNRRHRPKSRRGMKTNFSHLRNKLDLLK